MSLRGSPVGLGGLKVLGLGGDELASRNRGEWPSSGSSRNRDVDASCGWALSNERPSLKERLSLALMGFPLLADGFSLLLVSYRHRTRHPPPTNRQPSHDAPNSPTMAAALALALAPVPLCGLNAKASIQQRGSARVRLARVSPREPIAIPVGHRLLWLRQRGRQPATGLEGLCASVFHFSFRLWRAALLKRAAMAPLSTIAGLWMTVRRVYLSSRVIQACLG